MHVRFQAVTFTFLITLSISCASTPKYPFNTPSPLLKEQISKKMLDLRYTHGMELVNTLDWLARCGEMAYPALIEGLDSDDVTTRSGSANVLGRCGDRRIIAYLSKKADDDDPRMRYEVSRALLRLGDWSCVPTLIEGMRDKSEYVRALCNEALKQSTQLDFGFVANASDQEREEKVKKWEQWWEGRSKDSFLATKPSNYSRKN